MTKSKCENIIAIPARIGSTRLEKKVLQDIGGKTMLEHVLSQCSRCKNVNRIIVFTDDLQIHNLTVSIGFQSTLSNEIYTSGSQRIASNLKNQEFIYKNDPYIVNVQADQPFIEPKLIDNFFEVGINENLRDSVLTCVYKLEENEIKNPNIVKVVLNKDKNALYFSRSPIPYIRDKEKFITFKNIYYGHVGIYGYRPKILLNWDNLPESKLEKAESLEQLRLLEAGIKVATIETLYPPVSIDTYEQLEDLRRSL